jgi:hypothetical protein
MAAAGSASERSGNGICLPLAQCRHRECQRTRHRDLMSASEQKKIPPRYDEIKRQDNEEGSPRGTGKRYRRF